MTDHTGLTHALVADDEPHIGRIIKMKLEQGPFRVTLAYDGREALEVLRREGDIGLVLLDLMMPDVTGFDVVEALRSDSITQAIPIMVLTAKDLTEADKRQLNGHVSAVLSRHSTGTADLLGQLQHVIGSTSARE